MLRITPDLVKSINVDKLRDAEHHRRLQDVKMAGHGPRPRQTISQRFGWKRIVLRTTNET